MHPNPAFRGTTSPDNLGFARQRSFGILSVNGDTAPLLAHVPFILSPDNDFVDLHLMRSNPIARALTTPRAAVIAVTGPDAYVSPDWYGAPDQVPTWNYITVHLRGALRLLPDAELRGLLDRQSEQFETRLGPKPPWTAAKMDPQALDRMMRMIVPCRMAVGETDGTWKLGQNKSDAMRISAADRLGKSGIGQETKSLASWMRKPPKPG